MSDLASRRVFLGSTGRSLGAAWLCVNPALVATLSACARDAARAAEPFVALTAQEAATMRALAARIVPSDDLPGAEEAGAVYFVDLALDGPMAGMAAPVRAGLTELDARAIRNRGAAFGELAPVAQDELIREVEDTEFFALARMLVLMGVLADPVHGGNRNGAAPELVGIEHASAWRPPFGYYDAAASAPSPGGEAA